MDRRGFLTFGAKSAAIILTPGLLMPVAKILTPDVLTVEMIRRTATELQINRIAAVNGFYYGIVAHPEIVDLQRELNERRSRMLADMQFLSGSKWASR